MSHTRPTIASPEAFEAQRERLRAIAYRMLGSHADAEDVVQEAWLRLSRQDATHIDNLAGWLTTVAGRISLDVLRSRQARPQASWDDQSAPPVVVLDDTPAPEDAAVLTDSVGLALQVVLHSLRPGERLAFVLHDLFAVPFDEIARILGRSTDATKMLASRARRKVRTTERPTGSAQQQRAVVQAFLTAARHGDFEELLRILDPEVKLTVDTPAGPVVTLGATRVAAGARLSAGAATNGRTVLVNGLPGIIAWHQNGTPQAVLAFTVRHGQITAITVVADPAELALIKLPWAQ